MEDEQRQEQADSGSWLTCPHCQEQILCQFKTNTKIIAVDKPSDRTQPTSGSKAERWRASLSGQQQANAENIRNQRPHKDKRGSKFKGVYQIKPGVYRAQIQVNRKKMALGEFASEEEAALVYDSAARRWFGEFAYVNFQEVAAINPMSLPCGFTEEIT